MKAIVDEETCIGCGLCPELVPDVFRMTGEKAAAYVELVPADLQDACNDAAGQCPVAAIRIE